MDSFLPGSMSDLEFAILHGNKSSIFEILRQEDNINLPFNVDGDTAIHLLFRSSELMERNIIKILDFVIQRGADVNITNSKQETALHLAIMKWNKKIVDYLLQRDAKIDATDDQGNTVAHFFVKNVFERFLNHMKSLSRADSITSGIDVIKREYTEFTEWMLEKGFNFDYPNKKAQSALHLAIEYNLQNILPVLLRRTRDINFVNDNGQTLLHLFFKVNNEAQNQLQEASHSSNLRCINKKFNRFYPTKLRADSSLFSKQCNIEIVRILLERGVSIDYKDNDGNTALDLSIDSAKTKEDMETVKMVFDRFTDFQDKSGQSLLNKVMKHTYNDYYLEMAATLIAKGISVNEKNEIGITPLYYAFRHKNLGAIELMKENEADFSMKTTCGNNLFHALAENPPDVWTAHSQNELFDFLISQDCDVNKINDKGETPLHVAVDNDNIVIIQKLIVHGVDINCRDHTKYWTPLHVAAANANDSVEVAELLLKNGALINSKCGRDGSRPLHLAANIPHSSILKLLLRNKAEVNVRDSDGNSALVKALVVDGFANVKELLAYGADINDDCVISALTNFWKNSAGDFLLQHLTKLEALGLPCKKEYEDFQKAYHKCLHKTCLKEVDKLKGYLIDKRTSLYQWLRMDPHRRHVNENLRNVVESETLITQFPLYSNVILGHYRDCEARRQLLEPAKEALMKLIQIYLPDICTERIFDYLNTGHLFEIIELVSDM